MAVFTTASIALALGIAWSYGDFRPVQAAYLTGVLTGVVGAVVISQRPHNSVSWMMAVYSLLVGLSILPYAYGASAVLGHTQWPGGQFALWVDAWAWLVPFGLGMATTLTRIPEGQIDRRWRFVDWLAASATLCLVLWAAFSPGPLFPFGIITNPFGLETAKDLLPAVGAAGLLLSLAANVAAVASLTDRFVKARGEERQRLKWIALASALVGLTIVYAIFARLVLKQSLLEALLPFSVALLGLPVSFAFAILRYRLYDIDLIINRTLVYGTLTAILAGIYAAIVTLLQRLFLFATGQKSDAALVMTAFVIATLFTPIRDRVQKAVDRRIGVHDPVSILDTLTANVEAVLGVVDGQRMARRLVDDAIRAYDARAGAFYLDLEGRSTTVYSVGGSLDHTALEVRFSHNDRDQGRLLLGPRPGGLTYSRRDHQALERSARAVAEALVVAMRLGHADGNPAHVHPDEATV